MYIESALLSSPREFTLLAALCNSLERFQVSQDHVVVNSSLGILHSLTRLLYLAAIPFCFCTCSDKLFSYDNSRVRRGFLPTHLLNNSRTCSWNYEASPFPRIPDIHRHEIYALPDPHPPQSNGVWWRVLLVFAGPTTARLLLLIPLDGAIVTALVGNLGGGTRILERILCSIFRKSFPQP